MSPGQPGPIMHDGRPNCRESVSALRNFGSETGFHAARWAVSLYPSPRHTRFVKTRRTPVQRTRMAQRRAHSHRFGAAHS